MPSQVGSPGVTQNGLGASVGLAMPTSIVEGRLLGLWVYGGRTSTVSFSVAGGWTLVGAVNSTNLGERLAFYAKKAAGSDTATWTTDDGNGARGVASICDQILEWSGVIEEITAVGTAAAGPAAPNCPNLVPGITRNELWLAAGAGQGNPTMTAPSGYGSLQSALLGFNGYTLARASRQAYGASEDPAAFGGSLTRPVSLVVGIPGVNTAAFMPLLGAA